MKARTIEIAIALAAFFAFVAYIRPIGTGFLAEANSHTQNLNIMLDSSESFMLRSLTDESVKIDSFSLSGKVVGDGAVAVYLNELLVYTNAKKMSGYNLITGFPVVTTNAYDMQHTQSSKAMFSVEELGTIDFDSAIVSEAGYITGSFGDTCIESCSIPPTESPNYTMKVYVEPGTSFTLGRILYIIG